MVNQDHALVVLVPVLAVSQFIRTEIYPKNGK